MERYIPIFIFSVFILILIFNYIAGTKVGLINKFFSIATIFIAVYLSKTFGPFISKFLNTAWFDNMLSENIQNIPNLIPENEGGGLLDFPISIDSIASGITSAAQANISKLSILIVSLLSYIIVFIVSLLIIKFISRFLLMIDYVPVLGTINRIGGGVFGIFEVLLISEIILFFLKILSVVPGLNSIVNYVELTPLVSYLYINNFVSIFLTSIFKIW